MVRRKGVAPLLGLSQSPVLAGYTTTPDEMVGAEGFEPSTLCSQSRCASQTALRSDKVVGNVGVAPTPVGSRPTMLL